MASPVSFRFLDSDVDRWKAAAELEGISFTKWAARAFDSWESAHRPVAKSVLDRVQSGPSPYKPPEYK